MADAFKIPDEYQEHFRRLMPYMAAPLQKDPKVFESLLIFLKLGGERLARVVIDALNANQRQTDIELLRRLREEALLQEQLDEDDDDDEDDEDEEENEEASSGEK